MIPQTFPSKIDTATGKVVLVAFNLSSISGLTRWVDYIPVKLTTGILASKEGTTDADGYIPFELLSSVTGLVKGVDYLPVYIDASATDAWVCSSTGYIPYGLPGGSSAALSLNFVGATTLDSRITFTRADATTCATYFDRFGQLRTATANTPRFDYDPVSLAPKGLLIEESRTNLLLHSRDMTQAQWAKTDVTAARTQVGIDGAVNSACLMTEGVAGTAAIQQTSQPITAASTITVSAVLKRGNNDWIRLLAIDGASVVGADAWFNLATGAVGSTAARSTATGISATTPTALGGGWYRCAVTVTLTGSASTTAQAFIASSSANSSITRVANATYIMDAAQLEVGAFPTSYIPTTTAAVTRAADSASMTGTNFSSWYNQTQGTFVAEFDRFGFDGVAGSVAVVQADDNTTNNRLALRLTPRSASTGPQGTIVSGGVVLANDATLSPLDITNTVQKCGFAYQVGVGSISRGGVSVAITSAASLPIVTQLGIGIPIGGGAVPINGHIRRIAYYNTRLTDAQLQSLTR